MANTTKLSDNIAEDDPSTIALEDPATDEYMRKFEQVETRMQSGAKQLEILHSQLPVYMRMASLISWAGIQQKATEDMYELLVEMNNYWAKK